VSETPVTFDDFLSGLWKQNPVLVQMLGMCPTLAVTNSVLNALAMGLATTFVLTCSNILVSAFKRFIPNEVRITAYILIIATFVTIADLAVDALAPNTHKALGPFIALIVANCLLLGRAEAFAAKATVFRSSLDGLGMGFGFTGALMMMGTIREVLGAGSFFGLRLFSPHYEPWVIMVLPPGGFLTLGLLMMSLAWWAERKKRRARSAS
jgi:electron transport complex protein RnfE